LQSHCLEFQHGCSACFLRRKQAGQRIARLASSTIISQRHNRQLPNVELVKMLSQSVWNNVMIYGPKSHPSNTIFMWLSSSRQHGPTWSPPSYTIVVELAFVDGIIVFMNMSLSLPAVQCRVTAALVGLLCSLLLDRFRGM
jgi:hypothetical protein